jgi:hypothetical protein
MSYIAVLPLVTAKAHLSIDDTSRDAEITRMIASSLSWVEQATNHIVYARDKQYIVKYGMVRVYDFPINTDLTEESTFEYDLHTDITGITTVKKTLNVGYEQVADVPFGLIDAALIVLEQLFFKGSVTETFELNIILSPYKRFIC